MTEREKLEMEEKMNPIIKGERLTVTTWPKQDGKVFGVANVTIGNLLKIKNIKLIDGENGSFLRFPCYKDKHGEYKTVCFPTREFRQLLTDAALRTFSKEGSRSTTFNENCMEIINPEFKATLYENAEHPSLQGFLTVKIPEVITFTSTQIHKNKKGGLWYSTPGYRIIDLDTGDRKEFKYYEPNDTNSEKYFYQKAVDAFKEAVEQQKVKGTKKEAPQLKKILIDNSSQQQFAEKPTLSRNMKR